MKSHWLVRLETGEEQVEADEVEIRESGVLAFHRFASRKDHERTLLLAFAPGAWLTCRLRDDR